MTNTVTENKPFARFWNGLRRWFSNNHIKLVVIIGWIITAIFVRRWMTDHDITLGQLMRRFDEIVTGHWYGPLLYVTVYMLRPVVLFMFPASIFAVFAGHVYGLWLGFIYALIAGVLSAVFPYLFGRILARAEHSHDGPLRRFTAFMRANPFQTVLIMRLLYLHYDAVNILSGNLRLPFWKFLTATALGNITGAFAFAALGASMQGDIYAGDLSVNPLTLLMSAAVLLTALGVSRYLQKRQRIPRIDRRKLTTTTQEIAKIKL